MGVATLVYDSFTGRGIVSSINDQDQLGMLAMIADPYRALELLARHPPIDPERIALIGHHLPRGCRSMTPRRFRTQIEN